MKKNSKTLTYSSLLIPILLFIFGSSVAFSNVPLHEWTVSVDESNSTINEKGEAEHITPENLTTWIFEDGTFIPMAKLQGEHSYSIITDHLGTPVEAYDEDGTKVWSRELNIYGETRKEFGVTNFVPFLYQGQYLDQETELAYNRFRYYSPKSGTYVSQDPIGLLGGTMNFYSYVPDINKWIDVLGLECSQSIMNNVGPLTGKKKADIQQTLQSQGFTKTTAGNGGEIWTKAGSDGRTASVRLDPPMIRNNPRGFADEVPHAHKEIVPTSQVVNGNYPQGAATKLDDLGNISSNPRDTHIPIID